MLPAAASVSWVDCAGMQGRQANAYIRGPSAEAGARGGAQATNYEFRACFDAGPGTCDYSCLRCAPCAGAPPFPTPPPSAPPPGWGYLAVPRSQGTTRKQVRVSGR